MPDIQEQAIKYHLDAALSLQKKAYLENPNPSLQSRLADLDSIMRFVKEQQENIIAAINADYGKRSRHETLFTEIAQVLASARHCKKHLAGWMKMQRRPIDRILYGLAKNRVLPQPLGVVGVIVPWNFPLNLSFVPLVYIFAAGNRAMVKMSENSSHLAQFLLATIPQYFPADKLQFFAETGEVGIAFSALPFNHLLFTGSGATGRAVMASAAKNLCPVTLELGGKAPAIIDDDFDLKLAVERILFVKALNAGQICTNVDYAFIPHAKLSEFVKSAREIMPRRYADINSSDYTSIINPSSFTRLQQSLEEAKSRGAEVIALLPGQSVDVEQHRMVPHLVLNPPADCALMRREIFGPILPVITYQSIDDVIAQINAGDRPLALYPFSNNRAWVNTLIERIMSGGVSVNDALWHVAQDDLPFGGVGESGMGHYHGYEGFITFSKLRPIFYQSRFATGKILMPPYGALIDRLVKFLLR